MSADDRTVHAVLADGGELARYDRAGRWYLEYRTGMRPRRVLSLSDAATLAAAPDAEWFEGRSGGRAFDARVRKHRR